MAKYQKRPVIVEAYEFHMPAVRPVKPGPDDFHKGVFWKDFGSTQQHPYVITIHKHDTPIENGDWIIMEPDGKHYYPCKPDVFFNTYEYVGDIS